MNFTPFFVTILIKNRISKCKPIHINQMAKKQFKIGECAIGGIITVEIIGKVIEVKALDYFSKTEVSTGLATSDEYNAERKLDNYLNELTTSYYASKVLDWIKTKVKFDCTF